MGNNSSSSSASNPQKYLRFEDGLTFKDIDEAYRAILTTHAFRMKPDPDSAIDGDDVAYEWIVDTAAGDLPFKRSAYLGGLDQRTINASFTITPFVNVYLNRKRAAFISVSGQNGSTLDVRVKQGDDVQRSILPDPHARGISLFRNASGTYEQVIQLGPCKGQLSVNSKPCPSDDTSDDTEIVGIQIIANVHDGETSRDLSFEELKKLGFVDNNTKTPTNDSLV